MICNNCRYQFPDGLNFCPNCGIQINPQAFRPYQTPPSNYSIPGTEQPEVAQKSIFTLGIIAFSVNFFWILIRFLTGLMGYEIYSQFSFVFKLLSFLTTITTVFFAFVFVKKQSYKNILLILFIVLILFEIYQVFLRDYFGRLF